MKHVDEVHAQQVLIRLTFLLTAVARTHRQIVGAQLRRRTHDDCAQRMSSGWAERAWRPWVHSQATLRCTNQMSTVQVIHLHNWNFGNMTSDFSTLTALSLLLSECTFFTNVYPQLLYKFCNALFRPVWARLQLHEYVRPKWDSNPLSYCWSDLNTLTTQMCTSLRMFFLLRIREVPGSHLGPRPAILANVLRGLPHFPETNTEIAPRLHFSAFFRVPYCLIILSL
jgi:hypothetical protein